MAKQKTCKICKNKFTPTRQLQPTCSKMSCMIEYSDQHLNKKVKEKKTQARIEKREYNLKDLKARTKIAKQVIQKYVRLRDINEPCISCGKPTAKQWDGGHYMNAEYYSATRFNTWNINKQCSYCNDFASSNALNYRINLIKKIGLEKVEWLENQKQVVRYDTDYLNRLIKIFRKKIRKLENK